jgi:glycosyltransferase involved in cell wall biosynthesis
MELTNVVMLEQQAKVRMPGIWDATAVSLVVLRDQPLFRSVIPSKIFESLAMKKPVILGVRGESEQIINESGAGVCIRPESPRELADAVKKLHADRELLLAMGERGRRYVTQNFDRNRLAARFLSLLESLVAEGRQFRVSSIKS